MSEQAILPEGKYVDIANGYRIHLHDEGSGEPVVFLHGSGPGASGYSNFKQNYPALVEAGYRVIIPDLIGYGFSDKPDDVEYPLSFFAECVQQALHELGVGDYTAVGNSLGGAIALQLALDAPQRVQRLILMAPGGIEETEVYFEMEGIKRMFQLFTSEEGLTHESMGKLLGFQLYDSSLVTDRLVDERMTVYNLQNRQALTTMKVPNLTDRLSEIRCPVLGFWGMEDKFCPAGGTWKVMERCEQARFVLVNRCGHWVMVEHRDTFNRMCVDFLRNG